MLTHFHFSFFQTQLSAFKPHYSTRSACTRSLPAMGGLTERQVAGNTRAEVLGWPLPCPEWWIDNYEPQNSKKKQQHVNWYKLRARLLVRLSEGFVLVAGVVLVGSCVPSVWSARALRLECSVRGLVRVPSAWSVVVRGLPWCVFACPGVCLHALFLLPHVLVQSSSAPLLTNTPGSFVFESSFFPAEKTCRRAGKK